MKQLWHTTLLCFYLFIFTWHHVNGSSCLNCINYNSVPFGCIASLNVTSACYIACAQWFLWAKSLASLYKRNRRNFGSCAREFFVSPKQRLCACASSSLGWKETSCARASRNNRSYQRRKTDLFPPLPNLIDASLLWMCLFHRKSCLIVAYHMSPSCVSRSLAILLLARVLCALNSRCINSIFVALLTQNRH